MLPNFLAFLMLLIIASPANWVVITEHAEQAKIKQCQEAALKGEVRAQCK